MTPLKPISVGKVSNPEIKIINGEGYDPRQPIPMQYKDVYERFKVALDNEWRPSEIGMNEDKTEWNADNVLTDAERWLFKTNISYLTASDSLVPDNLIHAVMANITAYEMNQYFRRQIAEEAIHLESYLHILESFGLDEKGQGEIFSLYQEIPALTNKLNWNLDFSRDLATLGSNRCLLENLISYYVFEFLFFPLGFSQIFALARSGKLKNTAEQYAYIWRDENMHSSNCLWLIHQIIKENPELWDHKMVDRARAIIHEAVNLEIAYAHASMPDGGIIGFSVNTYIQLARFMADVACRNLKIKSLFGTTAHPAPWMSEFELNREKNFFESRVTEYRTGTPLNWNTVDDPVAYIK